jgi:hypothetical protein
LQIVEEIKSSLLNKSSTSYRGDTASIQASDMPQSAANGRHNSASMGGGGQSLFASQQPIRYGHSSNQVPVGWGHHHGNTSANSSFSMTDSMTEAKAGVGMHITHANVPGEQSKVQVRCGLLRQLSLRLLYAMNQRFIW